MSSQRSVGKGLFRRQGVTRKAITISVLVLGISLLILPAAETYSSQSFIHELPYNEEGMTGQAVSGGIHWVLTHGIYGYNRTYSSPLARTSYAHEAHYSVKYNHSYSTWSEELFGWHMGTYTGNFNQPPDHHPDPSPIYHSQPVVFWEILIDYEIDGGRTGGVWEQDVANGGWNTPHYYTINYVRPENGQYVWSFKIDSTTVAELYNWNSSGQAEAGCNRNSINSDCNNYGSFSSIQWHNVSTNVWYNLGYGGVNSYRYVAYDYADSLICTDPGYRRQQPNPPNTSIVIDRGVGGAGGGQALSGTFMPSSQASTEANSTSTVSDFKTSANLETAKQTAGFGIKTPKETLGGNISSVYSTDDRPENIINADYNNGLRLRGSELSSPIDYAARISSMQDMSRKANVHPDKLPYLVNVAGHQGMLWPAHKNVGDIAPGTAAIYWCDSGVEYRVAGNQAMLLDDAKAMSVANSFYK